MTANYEMLLQRDLEIVAKGARHLLGDKATCSVCGEPADLSDETAGTTLSAVDGAIVAVPRCSKHLGPEVVDLTAFASVPEADIRKLFQAYIDWVKPSIPYRYFITHPLSFFVPVSFWDKSVTCVAVIDTEAEQSFQGCIPAPLTNEEIQNPMFIAGGKLAADCVGLLELGRAGKLEFVSINGNIICNADAEQMPTVANPVIEREVTA